MMKVVLLVSSFLCVAPSSEAGGFLHSDLNQTVEAEEGHDVTLQGRLDPPVDLSSYTLDVARLDLSSYDDVYSYRRGKDHLDDQMDRYRGRTTLNHEDLIRGIVTLKISSVNQSDSGEYKVYVPDLTASFTTYIIVVPKGPVSKTKRNDPTTTRPPATNPGSAKEESVWKIVLASVCAAAAAAAAAGAGGVGVVLLLVKRGVIRICKKTKAAETRSNNLSVRYLRPPTTEEDGDPHSAAQHSALVSGIFPLTA
ncbi:butyrophilin subfamily 2 member A1-like isoform X2 [Sander lucioperca]|uniref:butyrophilin subfamily 2 member A1-like isoform X2 n=1 Tax=Sander lucioperca TaxID=283035 RepID=UPI0016534720|nr:butyrophilin subfamily 2 member A1-like isoform X2 [Sander lucioperca]